MAVISAPRVRVNAFFILTFGLLMLGGSVWMTLLILKASTAGSS